MSELPVIDIGPYLEGREAALEPLARELRAACEDVGFYHIVNHGIPQSLIDNAFTQAARFHALPMAEKMRIRQGEHYAGYCPPAGIKVDAGDGFDNSANAEDAQAAYHVSRDWSPDHPLVRAGVRHHIPQPWPDAARIPGFREAVQEYFFALENLARRLLPVHAVSLGVQPDYFDDAFVDATNYLRLIYYPPVRERRPDQFGLGAHTDSGFLTFLPQTPVAGLEILMPDGRWHAQSIVPGAFLVNLGQTFKRWTNDRFRATPHRVLSPLGEVPRYSIPFFFAPGYNGRIETVPTCIDADHPARYDAILYRDHLDEYLANTYAHMKNERTGAIA